MKTAVALGTFDGVHTGHRAVLDKVLPFHSVAVTFAKPPKFYFTDQSALIMTTARKTEALKEYGIKEIELLSFEEVRNLEAGEFLNRIYGKYKPERIACGFNYRFGRGALGDTELIARFCEDKGIEFCSCDCVLQNGVPVSSTYVRQLLRNGDIEQANSLIYGGFSFSGEVLHGDSRGHTLGFPTANQHYPAGLAPLKSGVYAAEVTVDGKNYKGISNIGVRPTFRTESVMSETFIKNFSGNIYGKYITVKPIRFLRGEKKFSSVDELCAAVKHDIESI